MIDVFYCTMPQDTFRGALAFPCRMRWEQICRHDLPLSPFHIVEKPEHISGREFQGWRRQYAEDHATGKFYIVADDDCMPLGNRFLERCEALMEKYSDYALLGTSEVCSPYGREEVFETSTGGGINVVRKGILVVPDFDGQLYDSVRQAEQIREKGYKVGRMRDVRRNHFGESFSSVWPDDYKSGKTQVGYLGMGGYLV